MSFVAASRKPTSRYRSPTHRSLPPLPPQWVGQQQRGKPPPLTQFVFLSIVLHGLVITLFGAPGGGAEGGRAVWRGLRVLQVTFAPAPKPAVQPSPAGEAEVVAPPPAPQPRDESKPIMPRLLDRIATPERSVQPPPVLVPPPSSFDMAPLPYVALPETLPKADPRRAAEAPLLPAPLLAPAPPPAVVTAPAIPRAEQKPAEAPPLLAAPRVEVPAVPAPPVEVPAPPRVEPIARPLERSLVQELEAPKPATALERALTREPPIAPAARLEGESAAPSTPPSRPSPFSAPGVASPAPGDRAREPSSSYDPTAGPQALDPDELRKRASRIVRGTGNRAVLPFPMPPVEAPKSKMETVIEAARKPDCRDHYKSLGLAAVVPLIANEFGEGKCKW